MSRGTPVDRVQRLGLCARAARVPPRCPASGILSHATHRGRPEYLPARYVCDTSRRRSCTESRESSRRGAADSSRVSSSSVRRQSTAPPATGPRPAAIASESGAADYAPLPPVAPAPWSLAALHPRLAAELDRDRAWVDPGMLAAGSGKLVWWRCHRGHSWCAAPQKRAAGTGCPYCAHMRAAPESSLAAMHPELAAEWHTERNAGVLPVDVLPGSGRHAWWRCRNGHSWQAVVASRVRGHGCPACADTARRGVPLSEARPDLVAEWYTGKNGTLGDSVMAGSHRRAWWVCARGHVWEATVQRRACRNSGCPYCAGRRVTPETSLAAVRPRLALEWHPTLNGELEPTHVLPRARRKVWWRCHEGHEWQATVASRAAGTRCPYCTRQRTAREKSLAALRPDLASELDPIGSPMIDPWSLALRSNRRAHWRCSRGHTWIARVADRTAGGGCPCCLDR